MFLEYECSHEERNERIINAVRNIVCRESHRGIYRNERQGLWLRTALPAVGEVS